MARGMRRKAASPPEPAVIPLRVNDLLFVNEYFRNGQNATQAYMRVHPGIKYTSAEVLGHRQLRKVQVQAELARRTRYDAGVTKEWGQVRLLDYEAMANAKGDYVAGASICMDAMKLAGFLVEKREVTTLDAQQQSCIHDLVTSMMRPLSPSRQMPSLPPSATENGEPTAPIITPHSDAEPSAGTA